jgi:hypothetical protein
VVFAGAPNPTDGTVAYLVGDYYCNEHTTGGVRMGLRIIRWCLMALIGIGVIQAIRHYTNFPLNRESVIMEMIDVGLLLFASMGMIILNIIEDRMTRKGS